MQLPCRHGAPAEVARTVVMDIYHASWTQSPDNVRLQADESCCYGGNPMQKVKGGSRLETNGP